MDQYVIGVLVSNISGVLSRVSGMFTRRGFNIDSLTVGETESSGFSRITIAFHGDEDIKERILQQLQKLHDVREVEVLDNKDTVIRELLLIKVRNKAEIRQAFFMRRGGFGKEKYDHFKRKIQFSQSFYRSDRTGRCFADHCIL